MPQPLAASPAVHSSGVAYGHFDWLRVVLATLVAADHAHLFDGFAHPANLAVQVFFALSGWLIGGILLNSRPADLPRFYFNRAARIWIPYFVAIALLVCASLLKEPVTARWIEFFVYKLTFVYNLFGKPQFDGHVAGLPLDGTGNYFWSICAEEQFYLIAPIFLCLLPSQLGRSLALWIVLSATAYAIGGFEAICFGVLAAVAKYHWGDWHLQPAARWLLGSVFVVTGILLLVWSPSYPYVAAVFSIASVLLLAVPAKRTASGEFWGGVSYPFYLNHWIGVFVVNFVIKRAGMAPAIWQPILAVLIGLAVSTALYLLIDRVVQARRAAWFTRTSGVVLGTTGWLLFLLGLGYGLSR